MITAARSLETPGSRALDSPPKYLYLNGQLDVYPAVIALIAGTSQWYLGSIYLSIFKKCRNGDNTWRLYTINRNLISMNFIAKTITYDLDVLAHR